MAPTVHISEKDRTARHHLWVLGRLLVHYGRRLFGIVPDRKHWTFHVTKGRERFELEVGLAGRSHVGGALWYAYQEAASRARDGQIPLAIVYSGRQGEAYLIAPIRLLGEVKEEE